MTPETALRIWARVHKAHPEASEGELLAAFGEVVLGGGLKKAAQDERARIAERLAAVDAEIAALP